MQHTIKPISKKQREHGGLRFGRRLKILGHMIILSAFLFPMIGFSSCGGYLAESENPEITGIEMLLAPRYEIAIRGQVLYTGSHGWCAHRGSHAHPGGGTTLAGPKSWISMAAYAWTTVILVALGLVALSRPQRPETSRIVLMGLAGALAGAAYLVPLLAAISCAKPSLPGVYVDMLGGLGIFLIGQAIIVLTSIAEAVLAAGHGMAEMLRAWASRRARPATAATADASQ